MTGENVTRQLQMVVCWMTLMMRMRKRKRKRAEAEQRLKWWKLTKEVLGGLQGEVETGSGRL